jgi:hypothetical protein
MAVAIAGDSCADGGCTRGVFRFEWADTAGEWCVWGVVGGLGDAPLLGRCECFLAEGGEAATAGDCWG